MALSIGVDVGGTKIAAGVVDEEGVVLATVRRDSPATSREAIFETIAAVADELAAQYDAPTVGVGAAGFTSSDRNTMVHGTNLDWTGARIADEVGGRTGKRVVAENDANAAGWAEARFGAGAGKDNVLVVTLGTGVGGAVMLDGRLIRGADGVAGEIGHICVERGGPRCGCGRRGCVEAIASGPSIARRAEAELRAAEDAEFRAAEGFAQTRGVTKSVEGSAAAASVAARAGEAVAAPISSQASSSSQALSFSSQTSSPLAERLRSGRPLTGKDVHECAAAGDPHAIQALDAAAAAVAGMCVDMANVFNPERIVVGGSVAITHPDWIARASELVAREALVPANREGIVVPAELGDDVSLVGAAFL